MAPCHLSLRWVVTSLLVQGIHNRAGQPCSHLSHAITTSSRSGDIGPRVP